MYLVSCVEASPPKVVPEIMIASDAPSIKRCSEDIDMLIANRSDVR